MTTARVALAGTLATLTMDIGNGLLRASGAYRGLRVQDHILISMPITVLVHYVIGITLAFGFYLLVRWWRIDRRAIAAIAYGTATSIFSLFLLFPVMGYGVLGLRSPELGLLRASVLIHIVYGIGLAWSFRALRIGGGD